MITTKLKWVGCYGIRLFSALNFPIYREEVADIVSAAVPEFHDFMDTVAQRLGVGN